MAAPSWEAWGQAAFDRAAAEDKPILLALTSPYPWACQLMDRDCWPDPEIIELATQHYVPVRVIVDLRPDIYDRYTAGTVPSTVFLTPQGQLLWGGGFLPPHELKTALARLHAGYAANKERLQQSIRERDALINRVKEGQYEGKVVLSDEILTKTIQGIIDTFDAHNGGFGHAPKTPLASSLEVLLLAVRRKLHAEAGTVLAKTLHAVIKGLWDPIDGGFFTMARTEHWTQPETEKLRRDQVALAQVLGTAGDLLGADSYLEMAARTLDWRKETLGQRLGRVADPDYYALDAVARKERQAPDVPPLAMSTTAPWHLLRTVADSGDSAAIRSAVEIFSEGDHRGLLDRIPGWEELGELSFRKRPLDENSRIARALAKLGRKDEARAILESFPDFGIDYGHMTAEYALAVDELLKG